MQIAYSTDKKTGVTNTESTQPINRYSSFDENVDTNKNHPFGPGGTLALLLVAGPFVLIGVIAFLLHISDGAKIGIVFIDAILMLIFCIIFTVKISKARKSSSQTVNNKPPINQNSDTTNIPQVNDNPDGKF